VLILSAIGLNPHPVDLATSHFSSRFVICCTPSLWALRHQSLGLPRLRVFLCCLYSLPLSANAFFMRVSPLQCAECYCAFSLPIPHRVLFSSIPLGRLSWQFFFDVFPAGPMMVIRKLSNSFCFFPLTLGFPSLPHLVLTPFCRIRLFFSSPLSGRQESESSGFPPFIPGVGDVRFPASFGFTVLL